MSKTRAAEDRAQELVPVCRSCDSTRILSLSIAFPNPLQPYLGIFVHSRLTALAAITPVEVVAPVAMNSGGALGRAPVLRSSGPLEVHHPRWIYPPLLGSCNGIFLAVSLLYSLMRMRRRYRFDLIDAHFAHPTGVASALLATVFRVPFVITIRGDEVVHARYRLRRAFMRFALRRASRVVAVSERLREWAAGLGVAPERLRVIPNGVDIDVFYPRDRNSARQSLGVATDAQIILCVGNLVPLKGYDRVIRAVAPLRQAFPSLQLLIAGEGARSYKARLRQLIWELQLEGAVHLLGPVTHDRLPSLMSAADVLCLASEREGWPNVVHEALSCGTPVVATDVGAIPDLVPAPDYGLIVPPGDTAALTHALDTALRRRWDRERISDWGRSRSWAQVARELRAEFEAILSENSAR